MTSSFSLPSASFCECFGRLPSRRVRHLIARNAREKPTCKRGKAGERGREEERESGREEEREIGRVG